MPSRHHLSTHVSATLLVTAVTVAIAAGACKSSVEYYCDQDQTCPERYPDRPYCDVEGIYPASEGRGHTCIPNPFGDVDAGVEPDGGTLDAALPDAVPTCTGCPDQPRLLSPRNGFYTGTYRVSANRQPHFLWHDATGPATTRYEITIDDSCAIGGFESCDFPSAELFETTTETSFTPVAPLPVSTTPPVGTRYYWSVRACNDAGCSPWATPRYLEVGRLRNDIDGDGYGDLLVGAILQDVDRTDDGAAYVYFGGPRPAVPSTITAADLTFKHPEGNQDGARFGGYVATLGDVDGDGYSDLAISAYTYDGVGTTDEGRVYLYYGRTRASWSAIVTTADVTFPSPVAQDSALFGQDLHGGADLNGDGYVDLVFAAPGYDGASDRLGRLFAYWGGPAIPAVITTPDLVIDNPLQETATNYARTTFGDLNGDGLTDLIAAGEDFDNPEANEGAAFIYFGRRTWTANPEPDVIIDNPADADARFGVAVAACDLDQDGYDDLAVGDSEVAAGGKIGRVHIYSGKPEWLAAPLQVDTSDFILVNPSDQDAQFGGWLDCELSVDNDRYPDLLVGADYFDGAGTNDGGAYLFRGRAALGTITGPDATFRNPTGVNGTSFGRGAAASDLDGDGFFDVSFGAPGSMAGNHLGTVFTWYGRSSWPDTPPFEVADLVIENPLAATTTGGAFGMRAD